MAQPLITSRFQRRRAFLRRLRLYGYGSVAVLFATFLAYLFIASPLFKVGSLSVSAPTEISEEGLLASLKAEVLAQPLGWLGADNYLSWPDTVSYTGSAISSVRIEKSFWSRGITITALPRTRAAVWCDGSIHIDACYWVDDGGLAFQHAPRAEGQLVQTIVDATPQTTVVIEQPVIDKQAFSIIQTILKETARLGVSTTNLNVHRELQEFWVDTEQGARIIFSLRFDPVPTALPALTEFLRKPGLGKLAYINLTVENRAYVKYR